MCIGLAMSVPPLYCILRALGGAVALYFVVSVAGRMILSIMVDTVIQVGLDTTRDSTSDNAG